jgi:hypothetical protein
MILAWADVWEYTQEEGLEYGVAVVQLGRQHTAPQLSYVTPEFLDKCLEFRNGVRQARAEARVNAEMLVYAAEPFKWLRHGPGRQRADEPGWGDQVQVEAVQEQRLQIEVVDYRTAAAALAPADEDDGGG